MKQNSVVRDSVTSRLGWYHIQPGGWVDTSFGTTWFTHAGCHMGYHMLRIMTRRVLNAKWRGANKKGSGHWSGSQLDKVIKTNPNPTTAQSESSVIVSAIGF